MKIELTPAVIACLKRGLNCWPQQNFADGIEIKEILKNEKFGYLVRVNDHVDLSNKIKYVLSNYTKAQKKTYLADVKYLTSVFNEMVKIAEIYKDELSIFIESNKDALKKIRVKISDNEYSNQYDFLFTLLR